jgi:FkbM family methyltransferase
MNALHYCAQQFLRRVWRSKKLFALRSKAAARPLWCRAQSSDWGVFHQIFVVREYSCLDEVADPRLIIDCGANVGYSSAYFLSRFPTARVIAIEPDPGNFEMLERNLRPYRDRVQALRSAVWSHAAGLVLDAPYRDGREWARRVSECPRGETPDVMATDIGTLLKGAGANTISILKIDVEGAEATIFANNYESWIDRVDNLVVELHDEGCADVFFHSIAHIPFTISRYGELTICKKPPVPGRRDESAVGRLPGFPPGCELDSGQGQGPAGVPRRGFHALFRPDLHP